MKHAFRSTLKYKIKANHPDKDCVVGGWDPNKVYETSDTYYEEYGPKYDDIEAIKLYIKRDLMLVAGGGYRTDTIEVIDFDCIY